MIAARDLACTVRRRCVSRMRVTGALCDIEIYSAAT